MVLTPAGLRKAARETMAGGLAGRSAQRSAAKAALLAEGRQRESRAALRQLLLSQLATPDGPRSITALADRMGLPAALLDAAIPWLDGRHAWAVEDLRASLGQFAACAQALDRDLGQLLVDLPTTMGRFTQDPIAIAELVTRVDWLFDGWDRIALLWRDGVAAGQLPSKAALSEILPQVPPLPDEALTLIDAPSLAPRAVGPAGAEFDTEAGQRTIVSLDTMLARNERVITALA